MNNHKATPEQWKADKYDWSKADTEAMTGDSAFRCILELQARVVALEAQSSNYPEIPDSSTPPPVATEGNKKPSVINARIDGPPPAPHENWEDWVVEVFNTRTIKGVCLRAIAPGDFSFDEEEATPPPVATDEELNKIWNFEDTWKGGIRALYNLGIAHGQASSQEVAEPAPVPPSLKEQALAALGQVEADFNTGSFGDTIRRALEALK
jgi:hypothetical protein